MKTADPAIVIASARSWLGTPYHDQASLRGVGCDCLGLARGVWREVVGPEPFPIPPYSRDWGETGPREVLADGARAMMPELDPSDAPPGALVLFRMMPRAIDAFIIGTEMRGLTTIRSSASAYPAVTAFKALAADVKAILGPGTKVSCASDWSEYFGHQPGDSTGDVFFHLDPLWSDANIDFIGIDNYMPLSDWRDGFDRAYLQANIAGGEGFDWFYASAADRSAQLRTPITDGSAGKPWVFRYKDLRAWWSNPHFNRPGGIESGTPTAWVPQSKPVWFTELGCPAIDRGTNQPNVFFDPKSSESFTPYFSRRWRDDAMA